MILFVGLVAGGAYLGYTKVVGLTSTTPATIPSFDGGDDIYNTTQEKTRAFAHDVENHQAATIQLSADELNALIAHEPDMIKYNIHAFVSLTDNEGRLQVNVPTGALSDGFLKSRYLNVDISFEVHFDQTTKSVNLITHTYKFGNIVMDQNSYNKAIMGFSAIANQQFNSDMRNDPNGAAFLDQAKSIDIQNGQLVIETQ